MQVHGRFACVFRGVVDIAAWSWGRFLTCPCVNGPDQDWQVRNPPHWAARRSRGRIDANADGTAETWPSTTKSSAIRRRWPLRRLAIYSEKSWPPTVNSAGFAVDGHQWTRRVAGPWRQPAPEI